MTSPIHSYLFSPPPSPPSLPADARVRSPALTSLASLLPPDLVPRQSLDGTTLKARSPRTPQQSRFDLDTPAFPTRKDTFTLTITPSPSVPASPKVVTEKNLLSVPTNIPTQTVSLSLPRPLLRLIFLGVLVLSSIMLLCFAPGSRLPSLRAASASRRMAWAPDAKSFSEAVEPIKDWTDARDRDYVPPQVFAGRLSRRAVVPKSPVVARNPTRKSTPQSCCPDRSNIQLHPRRPDHLLDPYPKLTNSLPSNLISSNRPIMFSHRTLMRPSHSMPTLS